MGGRKIKDGWIIQSFRCRRDHVREANVNLDGEPSFAKPSYHGDADAFIICIFFDSFALNVNWVKFKSIGFGLPFGEVLEDLQNRINRVLSMPQLVHITSWMQICQSPGIEHQ